MYLQYSVDTFLDVYFEDVSFRQLLVPVSCQPDPGHGALLGQHEVSVEHRDGLKGHSEEEVFSINETLMKHLPEPTTLGLCFTPSQQSKRQNFVDAQGLITIFLVL